MKKKQALFPLTLLFILRLVMVSHPVMSETLSPQERAVDAIVSTQWLEDNIDKPNLVILDIRGGDLYTAGHIAGSINVPAFGSFFFCFLEKDCGLWMELPPDDALFETIGKAGIRPGSTVVVIARAVDSPKLGPASLGMTIGARVAATLMYAGVKNVAMLNGGYAKWAVEERAVSTETVTPTSVTYQAEKNEAMFVSKAYVEDRLRKSILVDARDADTYFGIKSDPLSVRAGHIPTAKALPAPWLWSATKDEIEMVTYTSWKDASAIREMALTILGEDKNKEIIVYCSVGGNASPVYYVLTEVIGYINVKIYDGSMQEWTADPEAPAVKYKYE